jgi:hypothetical protein
VRGAALWAAALVAALILGAPPAVAADPVATEPVAPADSTALDSEQATADSTAVPPERAPPAEPGGPDVRDTRSGGAADFLDSRPLARFAGSGGFGDRASIARGALPAAMTAVAVDGRRLHDRLGGGIAMPSARAFPNGTLLVPSGPDLSLLPLRTASAVAGPIDPSARPAGAHLSAVAVSPGRAPGPTPWARVSMGRGDLSWVSTGIEFGRVYRGGRFGLSGFLELEDASGPSAGGSRESEHLGGRTVLELSGGWRAEIAAVRSALDRLAPAAATAVENDRVVSDTRLALSNGRSALEVFHTSSWVRSTPAGGHGRSASSTADGVAGVVAIDRTPIESVRVEIAAVGAEGSLLADEERTLAVSGLASGRLPLAAGTVTLAAGGSWLGESAFPSVAATLSGGEANAPWSASAEVGGRMPTAIERLAAPLEVPGSGGDAPSLRGNEELEPERAFVVSADYAWLDLLSGVGVRGELAHVRGPIVVERRWGMVDRPTNGSGELAGAASLWAAAGDSLGVGARSTLDVFWTDEDGPLVSLEPVPRLSLAAAAWMTTRFFEGGFLEVRWELSLRHESGLARGPWRGLADDSVTSLDACAAARAGAVRIFLEVRDLLDTGGARVPDRPLEGRRIAAGFSTSLWN